MRILLFLVLFLFGGSISSQNCSLKSLKKKRASKRVVNLIKNKDFNQAKNIIRSYNEHTVFNALKAEILWLEGDNSNAKKIANEVIYVCDEDFPIVYYILAEISFQEFN